MLMMSCTRSAGTYFACNCVPWHDNIVHFRIWQPVVARRASLCCSFLTKCSLLLFMLFSVRPWDVIYELMMAQIEAYEKDQKYKEGKSILERALVVDLSCPPVYVPGRGYVDDSDVEYV